MKTNADRWQRFVDALKSTKALTPPQGEQLAPPQGFAVRVAARAAHVRREQLVTLWRRWSLRAAIASTCLFLVAALFTSGSSDSPSMLPVPAIEFPQ